MKPNLAEARVAWITRREVLDADALPANHAWGTDAIFSAGARRVQPTRIRWIDAVGARLRLGPNLSEQLWLFFNQRKYDFVIAKDTDLVCVLCVLLWLFRQSKGIFAFLHFPLRVFIKDFFLTKRCSVLMALSEEIHRLSLISYPRAAQLLKTFEWAVDIEFYDRIRAELDAGGQIESAGAPVPDGKLRILLVGITGRKFASFLEATVADRDVEVRVVTDSPDVLLQIQSLPNYTPVRTEPDKPVTYRQLVAQYLACDVVAIPLEIKDAPDDELIRHRATLWGITTLLEASALARPVVMTFNPVLGFDVGSLECGLCLREDDALHWKKAIQWCRGHKASLKAMGEQARRNVDEYYNLRCFRERLKTTIETYYASQ